jgi:predicted NBD/HSP70 family sugar kinase
MDDFGTVLGEVLREICMPFEPEAIILGGAISKSGHLFLSSANRAMGGSRDLLRPAQLFDDAPLIGAAVQSRQNSSRATVEANAADCAEVGSA